MAHWNNTYRPARFFFLDVRVGVIILASFMHVRMWTLGLDVIVIMLGWWVERVGLGFMGAMRAVREYIAGPYRPALPPHKIRGWVDYGRRRMAWEKPIDQSPVKLQPIKKDEVF